MSAHFDGMSEIFLHVTTNQFKFSGIPGLEIYTNEVMS